MVSQIVVSVGTDHHPFERILDWVTVAAESLDIAVFVQRGATPDRPGIRSVEYLSQSALDAAFESADVVVCHGGPGTIAAAKRHGHRPIVVARNPSLGEHVDDHQMRYAAKLAAEGSIDLASTQDEFLGLLAAPRPRSDIASTDADTLAAVHEFAELVERLLAGQLPRRRWRDRIRLRRTP